MLSHLSRYSFFDTVYSLLPAYDGTLEPFQDSSFSRMAEAIYEHCQQKHLNTNSTYENDKQSPFFWLSKALSYSAGFVPVEASDYQPSTAAIEQQHKARQNNISFNSIPKGALPFRTFNDITTPSAFSHDPVSRTLSSLLSSSSQQNSK